MRAVFGDTYLLLSAASPHVVESCNLIDNRTGLQSGIAHRSNDGMLVGDCDRCSKVKPICVFLMGHNCEGRSPRRTFTFPYHRVFRVPSEDKELSRMHGGAFHQLRAHFGREGKTRSRRVHTISCRTPTTGACSRRARRGSASGDNCSAGSIVSAIKEAGA
jgi:hypothetical protein